MILGISTIQSFNAQSTQMKAASKTIYKAQNMDEAGNSYGNYYNGEQFAQDLIFDETKKF